jgi:hypothetical protein
VRENSFSDSLVEPSTEECSPGGATELSPVLQRWVEWEKCSSPGGTTEFSRTLGQRSLSRLKFGPALLAPMMLESGKFPVTARFSPARFAARKPGESGICARGAARLSHQRL